MAYYNVFSIEADVISLSVRDTETKTDVVTQRISIGCDTRAFVDLASSNVWISGQVIYNDSAIFGPIDRISAYTKNLELYINGVFTNFNDATDLKSIIDAEVTRKCLDGATVANSDDSAALDGLPANIATMGIGQVITWNGTELVPTNIVGVTPPSSDPGNAIIYGTDLGAFYDPASDIEDVLTSTNTDQSLSANQGRVLNQNDILSGSFVGTNLVIALKGGSTVTIDATATLADVRVGSGVYNAVTKALDFTLTDSSIISVPVASLLPVATDNTLDGDGYASSLSIGLSTDAGNILVYGTDGKLYVAATTQVIVSTDANNNIVTGSDGAAWLRIANFVEDNLLSTNTERLLSANQGNVLSGHRLSSATMNGSDLDMTLVNGTVVTADLSNLLDDTRVASGAYAAGNLTLTMTDANIVVIDVSALLAVTTAASLSGDGDTIPLSVNLSADAGNILTFGTDGGLMSSVVFPVIVSTDASNSIIVGTDGGAFFNLDARIDDNLTSVNSANILAATQGAILNAADISTASLLGTNLTITLKGGATVIADISTAFDNVNLSSVAYNAGTKALEFTLSNATVISGSVTSLLTSTTDNTLDGDGDATPLSVGLSSDAGNIISYGTDGKIFATVAGQVVISTDVGNDIIAGTDSGAFFDLSANLVDNVTSTSTVLGLTANQGRVLSNVDLASGSIVGTNIRFVRNNGGFMDVDVTSLQADLRVTGGAYNAGTESLDFTMSDATTFSVPVAALLPVLSDATLTGDGYTTTLSVALSTDAGNILSLGTDGALLATVTLPTVVSADANNDITAGTDSGAFFDLSANVVDNLTSTSTTTPLSANQGRIAFQDGIASGAIVGSDIVLTRRDAGTVAIDITALQTDLRVSGVALDGSNNLVLTLTDASTVTASLSALKTVNTAASITGDGDATSLAVNLSGDAGQSLSFGTDGGVFYSYTVPVIVSADANNDITAGTDGGTFLDFSSFLDDNLTSTSTIRGLSAEQGRVLNAADIASGSVIGSNIVAVRNDASTFSIDVTTLQTDTVPTSVGLNATSWLLSINMSDATVVSTSLAGLKTVNTDATINGDGDTTALSAAISADAGNRLGTGTDGALNVPPVNVVIVSTDAGNDITAGGDTGAYFDLSPLVVDNVVSTSTITPLSANQGLVLNAADIASGTVAGNNLTLTLKGGGTIVVDVTTLAADNDTFVNAAAYNDTSGILTLTKTDATTVTADLTALQTVSTAASINGDGGTTPLSVNISADAGNLVSTGTDGGIFGTETTTSVSAPIIGHKITDYTNEAGATTDVNETITSIGSVVAGHQIAVYVDENGANTTLNETITSASFNDVSGIFSYVDEGGTTTDLDLSIFLDDTNLARLVSGTLNPVSGILTVTRDDASTFDIDLSALIDTSSTFSQTVTIGNKIGDHNNGSGLVTDILETVTTMVDNTDGSFTYTSEDATVTSFTTPLVYEVYNSGTQTVSNNTFVTIEMDTERDARGFASTAAGVLTLDAGTYLIDYSCSIAGGNNRCTSEIRVLLNGVEYPASRAYGYHRNTASGEDSPSRSITITLAAAGTIAIQFRRFSGAVSLATVVNHCGATLLKIA